MPRLAGGDTGGARYQHLIPIDRTRSTEDTCAAFETGAGFGESLAPVAESLTTIQREAEARATCAGTLRDELGELLAATTPCDVESQ